jgi:hypothetical protein
MNTSRSSMGKNNGKRKRKLQGFMSPDFAGFTLRPMQPSKKQNALATVREEASERWQTRSLSSDICQKNPFKDTKLSETYVTVSPAREWELNYKRYRMAKGKTVRPFRNC